MQVLRQANKDQTREIKICRRGPVEQSHKKLVLRGIRIGEIPDTETRDPDRSLVCMETRQRHGQAMWLVPARGVAHDNGLEEVESFRCWLKGTNGRDLIHNLID